MMVRKEDDLIHHLPDGTGPHNVDDFDVICWSATQLESSAKKLSEMYLSSMDLDNPTVMLNSESLAEIVNEIQTHSRVINRELHRTRYKNEVGHHQVVTVAPITFRTPTRSHTKVTAETIDEEIEKLSNLQGIPIPKSVWPEQNTSLVVPISSPVPWWRKILQFLGVSRTQKEVEVNIRGTYECKR